MIVYHGSNQPVDAPDVLHSYRPLDFGKGFYTTTNRDQAIKWAKRKTAIYASDHAVISCYEMKTPTEDLRYKTFDEDLTEWIDFVCRCRDGSEEYTQYDVISGKVANDKVFRVVDMYHSGIWDRKRALQEIKVYQTYDQIAFITQRAIDTLLEFRGAEEV